MKHQIKFLSMLLTLFVMSISFSACSSDDDEPENNNAKYDFSINWEVVDRGDYTVAEAKSLAASLTEISEDMITRCTVDVAKELFLEFCEDFRYDFATGYMKITLRAELVRNEGNKVISSKTFYIDPDGTTIKMPAKVTVR